MKFLTLTKKEVETLKTVLENSINQDRLDDEFSAFDYSDVNHCEFCYFRAALLEKVKQFKETKESNQ